MPTSRRPESAKDAFWSRSCRWTLGNRHNSRFAPTRTHLHWRCGGTYPSKNIAMLLHWRVFFLFQSGPRLPPGGGGENGTQLGRPVHPFCRMESRPEAFVENRGYFLQWGRLELCCVNSGVVFVATRRKTWRAVPSFSFLFFFFYRVMVHKAGPTKVCPPQKVSYG